MKQMNINASIVDTRKVQEDTLAQFDAILINCAILITSPAARAMMARHNVHINCSKSIDLDDETTLNTLNGKTTFTGRNTPNGRQYLLINGTLTITPDAGDALRQYMGMSINGTVYCPDFLGTVLASKADLNGKLYTYPEGAVLLKNNAVLDKAFALRAESRLYWAAKRLIAVDEELDGEELAAKGARFMVPEAYVSESLADSLAPLFDADTRMVVLPDGTYYHPQNSTLSNFTNCICRAFCSPVYSLNGLGGDFYYASRVSGTSAGEVKALATASGATSIQPACAAGVNVSAQNPAGAVQFIQTLLSEEVQSQTTYDGVPVLKSAVLSQWEEGFAQYDASSGTDIVAVLEGMDPNVPSTVLRSAVGAGTQKYLDGASLDEAVETARQESALWLAEQG